MQLFQQDASDVPAVPAVPQQSSASPSGGYSHRAPESPTAEALNTLDEPVWHTIRRDLKRIYGNLVLVVFPFKNRDQQSAALRNWDLWGPMVRACHHAGSACFHITHEVPVSIHDTLVHLQVFTLTLAICLSAGSQKPGSVFSVSNIHIALSTVKLLCMGLLREGCYSTCILMMLL